LLKFEKWRKEGNSENWLFFSLDGIQVWLERPKCFELNYLITLTVVQWFQHQSADRCVKIQIWWGNNSISEAFQRQQGWHWCDILLLYQPVNTVQSALHFYFYILPLKWFQLGINTWKSMQQQQRNEPWYDASRSNRIKCQNSNMRLRFNHPYEILPIGLHATWFYHEKELRSIHFAHVWSGPERARPLNMSFRAK